MMTDKTPSEPSMDEILASIRKIISTDSKESTHSYLPHSETEDVLDLTDVLPEELEKTQAPSKPSEFHLNNLGEWSTPTGISEYLEEKEKNLHEGTIKTPPYEPTTPSFEESLISQTTLSETTEAFHLLNKMAQEKPKSPEPRLSEGMGGQTLENLTRELLKPLLKEWLDAHLPALVRSVVTHQVEKIVHQINLTPPELHKEKSKTSSGVQSDRLAL